LTDKTPLESVTDEARRVATAADAAGVTLRVTGGVGIALTCSSALTDPLARSYSDIDVVSHAKERKAITALLLELGYLPDEAFNALHGARRLFFWDATNQRQLDVFLDKVEMCHVIDLHDRLDAPGPVLTPADLLLMKLQVVESNVKDLTDIVCLLTDNDFTHGTDAGIDLDYLAALTGEDWGLWRTVTMVADRAGAWARQAVGLVSRERVQSQVRELIDTLETAPKSRAWKLRARVGDRKKWYMTPEETH
jgi:Uncharacterised nucleotidyltransferase